MILNAKALLPLLLGICTLFGCAPNPEQPGATLREAVLTDVAFTTRDNETLPVRIWNSKVIPPRAVIVGLHGFNDYGNAFNDMADYLAKHHRIYTYAYDQRGFGESEPRGTWAGTETYVQDLRDFTDTVRARFPNVPVYVMGESMGGAIAMVAFASRQPPNAEGVILSAPAVWARRTMPWYQRFALFIAANLFPWASFTGESLDITPSDNRDMLIALGRDPLVIKGTEVSAMYGLTNLMDAALRSAESFNAPSLIMIGELDQIVPNRASAAMLNRLNQTPEQRIAIYDKGYHMLFRDLSRQLVWDDVAAWITEPQSPLPSGSDQKPLREWIQANL